MALSEALWSLRAILRASRWQERVSLTSEALQKTRGGRGLHPNGAGKRTHASSDLHGSGLRLLHRDGSRPTLVGRGVRCTVGERTSLGPQVLVSMSYSHSGPSSSSPARWQSFSESVEQSRGGGLVAPGSRAARATRCRTARSKSRRSVD